MILRKDLKKDQKFCRYLKEERTASAMEKEIATSTSIFAWKIPGTEQPGRLQSEGSQSQTLLVTKEQQQNDGYSR